MKRIIFTLFIVAALDPASAADTVAQRLAAAKAACPNCYRVLNTNGVFVGVTKAEYDAIQAAKEAERQRVKASMERRRPHTPRRHPQTGRGPIQLRRGYFRPAKQGAR